MTSLGATEQLRSRVRPYALIITLSTLWAGLVMYDTQTALITAGSAAIGSYVAGVER